MSKKVFIIHGWGGSPQEPMISWLKKESEKAGFVAEAIEMPHPEEPTIEDWVEKLRFHGPAPDENTYFVGHSIGCQTILRYLERYSNKKVGGVVFISPWVTLSDLETDEEREIGRPWIETPINYHKIKNTTDKISMIFSDDDPIVPFEENKDFFVKHLGPTVIVEHGKGHFTEGDGVASLPSAIEELRRISK